LPLEAFTQKNIVADFIELKLTFIFLNEKRSLLEPPTGGLKGYVTYILHL